MVNLKIFWKNNSRKFKGLSIHVVPEQVEDFRRLIVRLKDILNFDNEKLSKLVTKKFSKTLGDPSSFRKFIVGSIFKN